MTFVMIIAGIFFLVFLFYVSGGVWLLLFGEQNEKEKPNATKGCGQMILCFILVIIALVAISMCYGGGPWQPRHTEVLDIINNVNSCIFIS